MDPDNEAGEKSAILVGMYSITLHWRIQGEVRSPPPPPPKYILQSSKHLVSCDEIEMVNCDESHTTLNSTQLNSQILDKIKWNSKPPSPPPKSRMKPREGQKRAIFPSLILWGGGGSRFSIYFFQDCGFFKGSWSVWHFTFTSTIMTALRNSCSLEVTRD